MSKLKSTIITVDMYAHQVISAAAVALSAIDPHQLPPKWAAGVVIAAQVVGLGAKYLGVLDATVPKVENDIEGVAGDLSGVIKTDTAAVVAAGVSPDPADPNAPKAA